MSRRFPLAELIVALAVCIMIALGVWQLRRADEKAALLARYGEAAHLPAVAWPVDVAREALFRHAAGDCATPITWRVTAGQNEGGEPGFLVIADCRAPAGHVAPVVMGWTKDPNARPAFDGGPVRGIVGPDRNEGARLVLADAPAPLQRAAPPAISEIPNNHKSYALQWFLFALTAVVIFVLARRQRAKGAR